MAETRRLHLISWNVAGWRTALDELARTTRQGPAGSDAAKDRQRCLGEWLGRLEADVVCLQETKLTSQQLEKDGRRLGASADSNAWETSRAASSLAGAVR